MVAYSIASRATTLLAKAKRLQKPLIQASFFPLLQTGRTSCSQGADPKPGVGAKAWGSQLQNPPRAAGVRECFVARPGWVFLDIDYSMMELRTWAQVCLWQLGYSELAKILNDPTRDPHVEMGGEAMSLSPAQAYALKDTDRSRFKEMRSLGKPINFGLPGGLGAKTFVDFAGGNYGVELVPGGSRAENEARARQIKTAWLNKYPEAGPYLQWVSWLVSKGQLQLDAEGNERKRTRIQHHQSGLIRGNVGYTDAANSFFQGLASSAAKRAMWSVSRAAYANRSSALYGARAWNFVHDELLVEVREDRFREASVELQERWCGAAQEIVPDVKIFAEPSAMRRWSKAAGDPVYDSKGRLAIYEDWLDAQPKTKVP
jgi:DNA polymerase I-like protein with 3'-5' exonuclease and polymerase domains